MRWSTYHCASHDWCTDGSTHRGCCMVCLLKMFSDRLGDKSTAYNCMHLCFAFTTSPSLFLGSIWWRVTWSFRRSWLRRDLLSVGRGLAFTLNCTNLMCSNGWGVHRVLKLGHNGIMYPYEGGGCQGSVSLAVDLGNHGPLLWDCIEEY